MPKPKTKKKVEYVEVMEVWKVKRTGRFLTAEKLVARIANGVPLEVYDGYAIEKKLVDPSISHLTNS